MRIKSEDFFTVNSDVLAVALLGKTLVRRTKNYEYRGLIAETECYMGVEDTACHASRKKPLGASALWGRGGTLYVPLIYGLYYMLNIVAGKEGTPMGVLIRGVKGIKGPGRLTKAYELDKDFNREDLLVSDRIWIEHTEITPRFITAPRVGIDYAEKRDRDMPWRFLAYDFL